MGVMPTSKKPEPAKESPEVVQFKMEYEALKKESERLREIAGRAQADLQNAKDRLERERQDVAKFALAGAMTKMLPTLDNLQRAFLHLPDDLKSHEWVKGIVTIESDLMRMLGDLGLRRMESMGQSLDPTRHEVLQTGAGGQGKVIEVFEEGYEFNGRVLRPAKVRVGDGSAAA
jgi:molecular chaperone GrpE